MGLALADAAAKKTPSRRRCKPLPLLPPYTLVVANVLILAIIAIVIFSASTGHTDRGNMHVQEGRRRHSRHRPGKTKWWGEGERSG